MGITHKLRAMYMSEHGPSLLYDNLVPSKNPILPIKGRGPGHHSDPNNQQNESKKWRRFNKDNIIKIKKTYCVQEDFDVEDNPFWSIIPMISLKPGRSMSFVWPLLSK
ncbi:hypothetical protein LENED_005846 [Lentinula edodes]|uniref:Uncharacterized protein n=1 Tax=Lentinula edodes TaxID=5353 RepID=A0A1Q3EA31_LENED|nr:hypothetical protein LENED_005846 [Lentinula edodes]